MGINLRSELQRRAGELFIQNEPFSASITIDINYVPNNNIIRVVGLTLPNNYLINRQITISLPPPPPPPENGGTGGTGGTGETGGTGDTGDTGPTFTEVGTYNILENTQDGNDLLLRVDFTFTQESNELLADIEDDKPILNQINGVISYLGTTTPSMLAVTNIPTYNDYFSNYEGLCEIILQFTENYQIKDILYDDYTLFVDFTNAINVDELETAQQVQDFLGEVSSKVGIINNLFSENEQYFRRLKTVMADLKVADLKITEESSQSYYDSRTLSSQNRINTLEDKFLTEGREGYADQIQIELFNVKIIR